MADLNNEIEVDVIALTGSVKSTEVTLTLANTAYLLPSSELANRRTLIIYNNSDSDIYIGGSDVTTSNGLPVKTGKEVYFCVDTKNDVYAVCGSAGKTVRVLELS